MKARNKHTGQECEVYWDMCDMGRKCQASDKPIAPNIPCCDYNAAVDDYDFFVDGVWVDGLEYIKDPRKFYKYPKKFAFTTEDYPLTKAEARPITLKDIERALQIVWDKMDEENKRFDEWFRERCKNQPGFAKAVAEQMAMELAPDWPKDLPIVIDEERIKKYIKLKCPNGLSIIFKKDEV